MRILRAAATYFLQVFGTGFALAFLRIPFLAPRFGVRAAELMEMPVMLAVIAWASHGDIPNSDAVSDWPRA